MRQLPEISVAECVVSDKLYLEEQGYKLFSPSSFADVERLSAQTGRQVQTPMLSVDRNDFVSSAAFYIFLEHSDQVVAGAAAKFVDLENEGFEDYTRRTSQRQYAREEDPVMAVSPIASKLIRGQTVYTGELEFREDHRGKIQVAAAFARVLIGTAFLKWKSAQVFYAFLPLQHRRIAFDYGFSQIIREAITWKQPAPKGRRNDHIIALVERDQLIEEWHF